MRGVTHTVKQVKVFDTHPGLPSVGGAGYEVTEPGDEDDFSFNSIQQDHPETYGFIKDEAPDPFSGPQFAAPESFAAPQASHDPFAAAPEPASSPEFNQDQPIQVPSFEGPAGFSEGATSFERPTGFSEGATSYVGSSPEASFLAEGRSLSDDAPVSYSRQAGIQQVIQTGGHETLVY